MEAERFGTDRHRPDGHWVQNTPLLEVAGIEHHKHKALAFAHAVKAAERAQAAYGVRIEPEPNNRSDANAIKVIGLATVKPILGPARIEEFHVGYVDRITARELTTDLIATGHPYAAELSCVYLQNAFVAVHYHVLVPKGSPGALRTHKRLAAAALDKTTALDANQRELLAKLQLGLYRNTRLEQAQALKKLGHFEEALDMYLRVAWLDQQGPSNVGLFNGQPMADWPAFQRSYILNAPGIISAIAAAANSLGVQLDTLQSRFDAGGALEIAALAPLRPITTSQDAWRCIEAEISTALADGGKWRAPKPSAASTRRSLWRPQSE
jgi:tetratricopeptide (TPR) repeat protein